MKTVLHLIHVLVLQVYRYDFVGKNIKLKRRNCRRKQCCSHLTRTFLLDFRYIFYDIFFPSLRNFK